MSVSDRPGCHCSGCLEADEVFRFTCPECKEELHDAVADHHTGYIAGRSRAESVAESHKHDSIELELVWRADGGLP